jgi:HSP20 family molecular chaperone IbpA
VEGEWKADASENRTWYAQNIHEGPFAFSFRVPAHADHENSRASMKQSLLTVTFPKHVEAKPRHILITCQ